MSQPLLKSDIPSYPHVDIHDDGVPYIAGTTMKIVELVEAKHAYGWSPEELFVQFPHLGLAKIHSALAYYWDHQAELDAEIESRIAYGEEARLADGPSPLAEKLRAARGNAR
jgi:uncharacterized protein (DUF433 family)